MDIIVKNNFSAINCLNKDDNFITTGCEICNESHETNKCHVLENRIHIEDSKVPPRALLTLPKDLKVETLNDGTKTVVTMQSFPKGTQFGPFQAKQLYALNPFVVFPLKIFGKSENALSDYYLDTSNEEACNWMYYISPAQNVEEQNLICYQLNSEIFYSVIRDIASGEHLKVWYSPYYAEKIGANTFTQTLQNESMNNLLADIERIQKVAERLPASKLGAEEKQNWCCKMCGQIENNVVIFAKHLQKHYTKLINNSYVCNVCNEGFISKKKLMKHKRMIHAIFSENSCTTKSIETEIVPKLTVNKLDMIEPIDNLMNETLTESDPSLLMLDQLSLTNTGLYSDLNDVDTLRAILCDDNNTNASKLAQEKSIADFSLEFVESTEQLVAAKTQPLQPPYLCDICNKTFQTLHYLCRHLKKHTGEFTCLECLVVFGRKENYLRHRCFLTKQNTKLFNCIYCSKTFVQNKYLKRHMITHVQKHKCSDCGRQYSSLSDKLNHNCPTIENVEKTVYECEQCMRKFYKELYLKRHICNVHKKLDTSMDRNVEEIGMCDVCGEKFTCTRSLKLHVQQHAAPKFECSVCSKRFNRFDIYTNHLLSHGSAQIPCEVCGIRVKTKKNLKIHMQRHSNEKKRYDCPECGKKFFQRSNLLRHQCIHKQENRNSCGQCNEDEADTSKMLFKCKICEKNFNNNRLLSRHITMQHNDKIFQCVYCTITSKHRCSIRRHLQKNHPEKKNEWNSQTFITSLLQQNKQQIDIEKTEVLLSVPETEQQITLGKNAFILDDGTIVQPQEEGNIMFYVLQNEPDK